tara:strand:+ start:6817 stop:6987 length:171 start_codon:yes stop_codon:yes gene_type:complete
MELVYRDRAEIIRRGLMKNYILNCLKNYMVEEGVKGGTRLELCGGVYRGGYFKILI